MDQPIQALPAHAAEIRPEPMLPEELMQRVHDHEHHQYHLYHWRSLRFLSYHPGLSQLMLALAGESRYRLGAMLEAMAGLLHPAPGARLSAWHYQGRCLPHFFILDDEMARLELSRILLEEHRTRRFYLRLRRTSALPGLDVLLDAYIEQCRAHCQLLEETRQSLPARHRPLGSVAHGRRQRRREE